MDIDVENLLQDIEKENETVPMLVAHHDDYRRLQIVHKVTKLVLAEYNAQEIIAAVQEEYPEMHKTKIYRIRHTALKNIRKQAETSLKEDYAWVRANYKRMMREAIEIEDLRMQGAILKDFCHLVSLDVDRIEQKVLVSDPQEVLDKLDNLLQ